MKATVWCLRCSSQWHMIITWASFYVDRIIVIPFFLFFCLSTQTCQTGSWHLTRRKPSASRRWENQCWGNTPSWKSLSRNRTSLRWERLIFKQSTHSLRCLIITAATGVFHAVKQIRDHTNYPAATVHQRTAVYPEFLQGAGALQRHPIPQRCTARGDMVHMHGLSNPKHTHHICFWCVVVSSRIKWRPVLPGWSWMSVPSCGGAHVFL